MIPVYSLVNTWGKIITENKLDHRSVKRKKDKEAKELAEERERQAEWEDYLASIPDAAERNRNLK